jgi:hypothetical protein
MPLVGFLRKHCPVLSTKEVVVVAVGSVPPELPPSIKAYQAIPADIRQAIDCYKLPCENGLKRWLTGPFQAYQLWKHADERGWKPSKEKLAPVVAALRTST